MTIFLCLIILILVILIFFNVGKINEKSDTIIGDDLYDIKKTLQNLSKNVATRDDIKDLWDAINEKTFVPEASETKTDDSKESTVPTPLIAKAEADSDIDKMVQNLLQDDSENQAPTQPIIPVMDKQEEQTEASVIESESETSLANEDNIDSESITPSPAYVPFSNTQSRYSTTTATVSLNNENDNSDDKSFLEKLLSANTLSKIGIVTFVLGIAFFVKYAIDQNWINEVFRVAIGIITGAIIIGVAHKLKDKYHVFSSILVGGGIATLYLTIAIAFQEYELMGQTAAFIIVVCITIFSVILSIYYDRVELAIFSLIGGYAAPFMVSTGDGNYIVLFTYILILNSGMLILAFRKGWNVIGMIAYPITVIFYVSWLVFGFKDQTAGAIIFATLFFVQFYLLALINHYKSNYVLTPFQAIVILSNNLIYYLSMLYIADERRLEIQGLITIGLAVVNAIVLFCLYKRSHVSKNMIYMIIGIVLSFVSLAIPVQLRGHVITMFWAAETVILLWLWKKSSFKVFYIGAIIIYCLAAISYIIDLNANYNNYQTDNGAIPIIINRIFITGIVFFTSLIANIYILGKDSDSNTNNNSQAFRKTLIGFAFLVSYLIPFFELDYQISMRLEDNYLYSFKNMILVTYTICFIAITNIIYRRNKSLEKLRFIALLVFAILFTIIYPIVTSDLRYDIFGIDEAAYPHRFFAYHLLALPAIASIIVCLAQKTKKFYPDHKTMIWSLLSLMSVILLSIETDNLTIMILGTSDNYYSILHDVHTFVYPILWGISAFILMVWGLKTKEVTLRKISLFGFGIIILKLYIIDVWQMPMGGRIISFVVLGIILLIVSFLQQKIKNLIKNEPEEIEENKNKNDEQTNI